MQFQQVNRTDAEKIFLAIKNTDASSMTTGYGVELAMAGASVDGISAVLSRSGTNANHPGFLGVAEKDIPANTAGLCQVYGFVNSVFLSNTNTSVTVNDGDPLIPGPLAGGLMSGNLTYLSSGLKYVVALSTLAGLLGGTLSQAVTANYTKGFVRAL